MKNYRFLLLLQVVQEITTKYFLKIFGVIYLSWYVCASCVANAVVISEFMAGNSYVPYSNPSDIKTRVYGSDSYPDWIELHNPTGASVDIGGMYLTDDAEWLTQWPFPAGTTIAPNGHPANFHLLARLVSER